MSTSLMAGLWTVRFARFSYIGALCVLALLVDARAQSIGWDDRLDHVDQRTTYETSEWGTLWSISVDYDRRLRANGVLQIVSAVVDLNPNAFIDSNANLMLAGYTIVMPTAAEIQRIDRANAEQQLRADNLAAGLVEYVAGGRSSRVDGPSTSTPSDRSSSRSTVSAVDTSVEVDAPAIVSRDGSGRVGRLELRDPTEFDQAQVEAFAQQLEEQREHQTTIGTDVQLPRPDARPGLSASNQETAQVASDQGALPSSSSSDPTTSDVASADWRFADPYSQQPVRPQDAYLSLPSEVPRLQEVASSAPAAVAPAAGSFGSSDDRVVLLDQEEDPRGSLFRDEAPAAAQDVQIGTGRTVDVQPRSNVPQAADAATQAEIARLRAIGMSGREIQQLFDTRAEIAALREQATQQEEEQRARRETERAQNQQVQNQVVSASAAQAPSAPVAAPPTAVEPAVFESGMLSALQSIVVGQTDLEFGWVRWAIIGILAVVSVLVIALLGLLVHGVVLSAVGGANAADFVPGARWLRSRGRKPSTPDQDDEQTDDIEGAVFETSDEESLAGAFEDGSDDASGDHDPFAADAVAEDTNVLPHEDADVNHHDAFDSQTEEATEMVAGEREVTESPSDGISWSANMSRIAEVEQEASVGEEASPASADSDEDMNPSMQLDLARAYFDMAEYTHALEIVEAVKNSVKPVSPIDIDRANALHELIESVLQESDNTSPHR